MALSDVHDLTECIGASVGENIGDLLSPGCGAKLRELLMARGVLVFRRLHATDEEQVMLARSIGTLRDEGEHNIAKITLDPNARAAADYLKGSFLWHMDGTHDQVPVFASLLSARKLSAKGGQTMFANSYAAFDALPSAMKARIADLQIVHRVETSMLKAGVEPRPEYVAQWRSSPDRAHRLVWEHETGRKSLVIGCHADHVVGMERAESDALIEELLSWITQPRFVYRHEWTPGDLVMWDNTGVLHRVEPYAIDSGRMMHRTTLMGEEAFA